MDTMSLRFPRVEVQTAPRRPPAGPGPRRRAGSPGPGGPLAGRFPGAACAVDCAAARYARNAAQSPPGVNGQEGKAGRTDPGDPFDGASPLSVARGVPPRGQSGTTSAAARASTAPMLGRYLDSETLAPLLASARQHGAAPPRLHAVPEAMLVDALLVARAVCRSHDLASRKPRILHDFGAAGQG